MCDKLVFDLSQEVEGSPNVFIRKDWINILDNQNQNYQNNQSIIDTSQLSNSNKYMSYRESYLAVPMLLTLVTPPVNNVLVPALPGLTINTSLNGEFLPGLNENQLYGMSDLSIGLKNWFGQIIHSMTLDYNGTTIVQQTPFCNMWNTFKLLTTLSYSDIVTQGSTIGFYPDTSNSGQFILDAINNGVGLGNTVGVYTSNNDLGLYKQVNSTYTSANGNQAIYQEINNLPNASGAGGNIGLTQRISWINYNPRIAGNSTYTQGAIGLTADTARQTWRSYISLQASAVTGTACGVVQISVMATIYLKHIHSFFNMVPLLKGVFMKLTMNLNNATSTVTVNDFIAPAATGQIINYSANVPVGGTNPIFAPSPVTGGQKVYGVSAAGANCVAVSGIYWYNVSVGSICLDTNITAANYDGTVTYNNTVQNRIGTGQLAKSIYLYVPAYTFNPVFEEAYLSNPVKQIKYTDIYQYQVLSIGGGGNTSFNNLITNGIANIKSVLIIPFYSQANVSPAGNFKQPSPVYQSPFDPAGAGCTSPFITLGNFNVQISGQNAIYNTQRYTFEEFNNQLYGQFAVNGGLTDGLTSGLIGFSEFQSTYGYYYVNVERMLPVEQSVPKSVQIIGTNYSTQNIDLWVFIEYGVEINIDLTTGARV